LGCPPSPPELQGITIICKKTEIFTVTAAGNSNPIYPFLCGFETSSDSKRTQVENDSERERERGGGESERELLNRLLGHNGRRKIIRAT
jgi:hypothetical protein